MEEKELGKVTHYFGKISVAVVEVTEDEVLKKGDKIHVKGATTDFEQQVDSMQVNHQDVEEAKKGDAIGLKVDEAVRENDQVFKVVE
jgi:translation elongation factor EF-1alpha